MPRLCLGRLPVGASDNDPRPLRQWPLCLGGPRPQAVPTRTMSSKSTCKSISHARQSFDASRTGVYRGQGSVTTVCLRDARAEDEKAKLIINNEQPVAQGPRARARAPDESTPVSSLPSAYDGDGGRRERRREESGSVAYRVHVHVHAHEEGVNAEVEVVQRQSIVRHVWERERPRAESRCRRASTTHRRRQER